MGTESAERKEAGNRRYGTSLCHLRLSRMTRLTSETSGPSVQSLSFGHEKREDSGNE